MIEFTVLHRGVLGGIGFHRTAKARQDMHWARAFQGLVHDLLHVTCDGLIGPEGAN